MGLNRLGNYLSQTLWNQNVDAMERFTIAHGGRAVLEGLQLSIGSGRSVEVSAGTLCTGTETVELSARNLPVAPSVDRYLWLNAAGEPIWSLSAEDPGGSLVCLGRVFSDAESVTAVTTEGRVEGARWTGLREFTWGRNDLVLDLQSRRLDLNAEARFVGEASFEVTRWRERGSLPNLLPAVWTWAFHAGELHGQNAVWTRAARPISYGQAARAATLAGDLDLVPGDAPIQALDPGGVTRQVRLHAGPHWGDGYRIVHTGTAGSLVIKVGSTTVCTIGPSQSAEFLPTVNASGQAAWPATVAAQAVAAFV